MEKKLKHPNHHGKLLHVVLMAALLIHCIPDKVLIAKHAGEDRLPGMPMTGTSLEGNDLNEPFSSQADDIRITGQVLDEEGDALPFVTILVKGTTRGTTTDDGGNFNIMVPDENTVLVFTYIGYVSKEITVGNQTELTVTLQADTQALEEVVVVGYGTESTKKLTTSISKVNEEQIKEMPITNLGDAFTGNISGVVVENGSGAPGDNPIIRVRGYGSINAGSEPLFVIDGMMVTSQEFRLLNPKAVESISVLKDAAAGAIYGSRAANGVVIVTTKSGQGKTKFNYNATIGVQQVERKVDVLSGPEYIEYSRQAYQSSGEEAPTFSPDVANTNWQDEIFRTGTFQSHQISANGSNENLQFNVALNYLGNKGVVLTTFEDNYSSNGNFTFNLSDQLTMGLTYNASYTKSRRNDRLGGAAHGTDGILEAAVVQYPVIPVYMENGDYGQAVSKDWGSPVVYGGYGNPVAALNETYDRNSGFSGIGRTYINYEPLSGLNINLSLGGVIDTRFRDYHESPYLAAYGHDRFANFSNPRYDNIWAEQSNSMRSSYTAEGYIDYSRTFSEKHNLSIIGGFSTQYNGYRATTAVATEHDRGGNAEQPLPRFENYYRPNIFGANDVRGGGGFWEETFVSVFSRINYDYDDKYLFMASVRRDGSSKFAPGSRYGVFPAVSAAWRISEEPFLNSGDFINDLKLRASYGVSGNDQIGNYTWQGNVNYGAPQYYYGPNEVAEGAVNTAYPVSIENPNLKWETNEQYNLGLDFSILRNRIMLSSDFYIRNTKDLLLSRPLPAENGIAGHIMDNIGNMTNQGVELALTTMNVVSPDFSWTTNWIFNRIWSKATAIHNPEGIIRLSSGTYNMVWIVEGEEMFQIYGYQNLGIFESEEELQQHPRPRGAQIGDPIIEDLNNDGDINSDDFQKLGSGLPKFTFGFTNTFEYKDFDLTLLMDGNIGASKYVPAFRNQSWVSPIEGNLSKHIYENAGEIYGASNLDYTGPRLWQNSYHVFDASFVRIKNLTLGYTLPDRLLDNLFISGLRMTLSAQNLHTFTSYPWFNPQSNYYGGAAGSAQFGVDYGGYPLSKTFAFGLNVTF